MSGKDYYKILGVDKSASKEEIKKKYRKLAMKYHPDQTKGDKAAETKFKDISEAYAVLSDDKKRKKYDTFGSDGFQQQFSQEDIFKGFDFGNVFREFGFGGGDFSRGSDGGMRFSFGGGSPFGGRGQGRRRPVKGTNLEYEMPLTLQEIVNGSSKTVSLKHAGGDERISIKIPPGMITGKKLRLTGKGEPSHYGGPPGDLFIKARVMDDARFRVEDYNLHLTKEITLVEAVLGTAVRISTVENKEISLTIPPGTKHKTSMRMPKHGLPQMNNKGRGDLYVHIHVKMPTTLTEKQKELFVKLSETGL